MIGTKKYLAGVLVLALATVATTYKDGLFSRPEPTQLLIPFDQLPTEINGWRLIGPPNIELTEKEFAFIQPDAYIRRAYRKGDDVVRLYIAYYGNRLAGERRIHHNSRVCMVAAGWTLEDVKETGTENHIVTSLAKSIPVDHVYFRKDGDGYFVTQFFSVDGELLKESPKPRSDPLGHLGDRLESLRSAGYCFQVQVGHRPRGSVAQAREVHRRFLQDTAETILRHFPAGSGEH